MIGPSLLRSFGLLLLIFGFAVAGAQAQSTDFVASETTATAQEANASTTDSPLETVETEEPDKRPDGGWLSILPALFAIALSLVFRQVVVSLFVGVWVGAWIVTGSVFGFVTGLWSTMDTYILDALANSDHAAIIIFSLMIGGVVGIIQKNGGTAGIVRVVTRWAKSARRGQIATALLGIAIFFDDYANTLIVGGTMRPITDRLKISREKLAYLVD